MNDPGLNSLLKWGIENSENGGAAPNQGEATANPSRGLNTEALAQLFGGPSDADLMREAMSVIQNPDATLDSKLTAFDNFEQLIEGIDNANNLGNLGLWMPLVDQLDNTEPQLRTMAAWCIGTSVQNNIKAQERALVLGVVPKLVRMSLSDADKAAKKKAIFALSSQIRNYQPAYVEALKDLPADYQPNGQPSSEDMDQIDQIITKLRSAVS